MGDSPKVWFRLTKKESQFPQKLRQAADCGLATIYLIIILGSPSKCIFKGQFEKKTGDTAAVVGCMDNETVVNIAHAGAVTELTLRDGVTLEFVPTPDNPMMKATRVKRETGKF